MENLVIPQRVLTYPSVCVCHVNKYHSVPQGGIKAVVWTDVFQSFLMLLGLVAVAVQVGIPNKKMRLFLTTTALIFFTY